MTPIVSSSGPFDEFSEDAITALVHGFYDRVREDAVLAPVFDAHIDDWTPHLARMVSFWCTVLGTDARYVRSPKGAPPQLHQGIPELLITHFFRWIDLWDQTTATLFTPEHAAHLQAMARRMAQVLSAHLPGTVDVPLPEPAV